MTAIGPTVGEMLIHTLVWWLEGPHTPPPQPIAELPAEQQEQLYRHVDALVCHMSTAQVENLLDTLIGHNADTSPATTTTSLEARS